MNLHEDDVQFRYAIEATAAHYKLSPILIEKDYWVVYMLKQLFADAKIGKYLVFKGGTSLSKCFKLIDRFSEDIDLVVIKEVDESGNQISKKIKAVSHLATSIIEECAHEKNRTYGNIRTTTHRYSKVYNGSAGQASDYIQVEVSSLGNSCPNQKEMICSYIADMLISQGNVSLIEKYGLNHFEVTVLMIRRTLCEKIMGLVKYSFEKDYITQLKLKIRHIYDINQMLKYPNLRQYVLSIDFVDMIKRVACDDIESYKANINWVKKPPIEAALFKNPYAIWEQLKSTYHGDFKNFVYGTLPTNEEIIQSLSLIQQGLSGTDWTSVVAYAEELANLATQREQ
jgi:predicted nucleotidyltransferase component of viral defense system